jgi:hypothetical protein
MYHLEKDDFMCPLGVISGWAFLISGVIVMANMIPNNPMLLNIMSEIMEKSLYCLVAAMVLNFEV